MEHAGSPSVMTLRAPGHGLELERPHQALGQDQAHQQLPGQFDARYTQILQDVKVPNRHIMRWFALHMRSHQVPVCMTASPRGVAEWLDSVDSNSAKRCETATRVGPRGVFSETR
jgi:hypothetical protein